jgi:FKBP-type peptidyl-prolyl cis-trans isomerase FkpA
MSRKQIWKAMATAALLLAPVVPALAATPSEAPSATPHAEDAVVAPVTDLPPSKELALESDQHKTLYALGLALSQRLSRIDLRESELAYVVAGLQDGVLDRSPRVDVAEFGPQAEELAEERLAVVSEREKVEAKQFLDRMAAEPGAVRTDSGLVILSQQEGTGPGPADTDTVRVNYEGTLPDGSVFDSSRQRGKPVTFPLDQVIPCWTEAVGKMKVGGRLRMVCPPELAYGSEGQPGIPPNSPLLFDIHLLGVGDAATPGQDKTDRKPLIQQVAALSPS